jgi:methylated-DNA-[protein]-cysteine S-methyltransferase
MIASMHYTPLDTPLGQLLLVGDGEALAAVQLPGLHRVPDGAGESSEGLEPAIDQLERYFAGELQEFDLELAPGGGSFDRAVWERVARIPYGETASYGQVACDIGHPGSPRAVGAANGRNPLAIVVPCHRVVGSDGSLTGYAGGLRQKQALLGLEHGGWQDSLL